MPVSVRFGFLLPNSGERTRDQRTGKFDRPFFSLYVTQSHRKKRQIVFFFVLGVKKLGGWNVFEVSYADSWKVVKGGLQVERSLSSLPSPTSFLLFPPAPYTFPPSGRQCSCSGNGARCEFFGDLLICPSAMWEIFNF
jgi:hypothetical protein